MEEVDADKAGVDAFVLAVVETDKFSRRDLRERRGDEDAFGEGLALAVHALDVCGGVAIWRCVGVLG